MKSNYLLLLLTSVFFWSCTKNKSGEQDKKPVENEFEMQTYFPKTLGSYWIYRTEFKNPEGNLTMTTFDSVYVVGDTFYRGHSYTMYQTASPSNLSIFLSGWLADSSNFIIGPDGDLVFAPNDYQNILSVYNEFDTFTITRRMLPELEIASTLAGDFLCLVAQDEINFPNDNQRANIYYKEKRAEGVGLVSKEGGSFSGNTYVIRLARYYIAPE